MEFNFEDYISKIFYRCRLLTSKDGEENGCAISG